MNFNQTQVRLKKVSLNLYMRSVINHVQIQTQLFEFDLRHSTFSGCLCVCLCVLLLVDLVKKRIPFTKFDLSLTEINFFSERALERTFKNKSLLLNST